MADHGDIGAPRAKFNAMTEGDQEDWMIIASQYLPYAAAGGNIDQRHGGVLVPSGEWRVCGQGRCRPCR